MYPATRFVISQFIFIMFGCSLKYLISDCWSVMFHLYVIEGRSKRMGVNIHFEAFFEGVDNNHSSTSSTRNLNGLNIGLRRPNGFYI